ncbi:MAG: iron uptake protein [Rubrivivax sp.]
MDRESDRLTTTAGLAAQARVASRIAAAVLGGYVFTWGSISLSLALLFAAGMEFHDAEHLSCIMGFLIFLAAFLWAFAARSLRRTWLALAGGGALMASAATLVQYLLLA